MISQYNWKIKLEKRLNEIIINLYLKENNVIKKDDKWKDTL